MSLSIIFVNYRAVSLIMDALHSFLPFKGPDPEIIVSDNGSAEAELAPLLAAFPSVKVISMGYNAGFARANNAGIRAAVGDVVLLLNPDTVDPGSTIEACYNRFVTDNYIAAAVQLLNEDGSPQISGNYFMRGGLNNLLPLPVMGNILKWLGYILGVKKTNLPDSQGLVEVDWINGAFMMLRKKPLADTGLLDEDFFLYAEEIEWCGRLRKAGKLCVYGDLKLIHLQGETANESFGSSGRGYYNLYDKKGLQIMVSNFLRIRKQFGAGWFLVQLVVYIIEFPLLLIRAVIGLLPLVKPFSFKMLAGFGKNLLQLIALTPRIIRNQPWFYKML